MPTPTPTRARVALVLGVLMLVLGAYVLGHLMLTRRPIVAQNYWLDVAFGAFFLIRGFMNIRRSRTLS
jgi:uncharacterized membrane protein HdeD (DUF308 family)